MVLATPEAARANAPHLGALATWAPAGAVEGLQLMAGAAQLHAGVKAYAIRCLHATPPAKVAFFLPQLVQVRLRCDGRGGAGGGAGLTEDRELARLGGVGGSEQPAGAGQEAAGRTLESSNVWVTGHLHVTTGALPPGWKMKDCYTGMPLSLCHDYYAYTLAWC